MNIGFVQHVVVRMLYFTGRIHAKAETERVGHKTVVGYRLKEHRFFPKQSLNVPNLQVNVMTLTWPTCKFEF